MISKIDKINNKKKLVRLIISLFQIASNVYVVEQFFAIQHKYL